MKELLRTNDFVVLSFVKALLKDGGVPFDEFDLHMNILDGNIAAIPRRIMVADEDAKTARDIVTDAGLAHVLSP